MAMHSTLDAISRSFCVLMLPDANNGPTLFSETSVGIDVTSLVALDLGRPELAIL